MFYKSDDKKTSMHVGCYQDTKSENQTFDNLKKKSLKRIEHKKSANLEIKEKNLNKYFWEGTLLYTIDNDDQVNFKNCKVVSVKKMIFSFYISSRSLNIFGN